MVMKGIFTRRRPRLPSLMMFVPSSLVVCVLAGCVFPAQYYLPDHKAAINRAAISGHELPTVRMKPGDTLDAVRAEKSYAPTGYWTILWVEDLSIVETRLLRREDKPTLTQIHALRPGRTKAYYTNGAYLEDDILTEDEREMVELGNWFWIEVVPDPE